MTSDKEFSESLSIFLTIRAICDKLIYNPVEILTWPIRTPIKLVAGLLTWLVIVPIVTIVWAIYSGAIRLHQVMKMQRAEERRQG